jgi:hypothetical protein
VCSGVKLAVKLKEIDVNLSLCEKAFAGMFNRFSNVEYELEMAAGWIKA